MTDNGSSEQLRDTALYSYELDSRRQNMILSVVAVAVTALIGGLTLQLVFPPFYNPGGHRDSTGQVRQQQAFAGGQALSDSRRADCLLSKHSPRSNRPP